jgi:hypothetical protein
MARFCPPLSSAGHGERAVIPDMRCPRYRIKSAVGASNQQSVAILRVRWPECVVSALQHPDLQQSD